ncbi:MAG TPA: EAL domain-containing protein [Thermomicrobiales bacterium]|jgi:EAL domain-containing protein (putative c-di-GMP-specific phosphodiesterase class I)
MQAIALSVASNAPCQRCEGLPEKLAGAGRLYLWFPLGHSLGKALAALHNGGASYERLDDGQSVRVSLREGELEPFVTALAGALSGEELRDTQSLFTTDPAAPALSVFPQVTPLSRFIGQVRSGWLLDLMRERRLTCHFQPIVHATEPGEPFAHEALLRGLAQDGAGIAAGPILDLAREAGLLFQLDLLARRTAIREAAGRGIGGKIFINFNPTAIYDPAFCLRSTVAAIDAAGISRDRIVFEITESDRTQDLGHLQRILHYYRDAGFAVALDDFGSGYSSLNLLHQLRPDYLKLDMELIRDVHRDPYKALIARKILEVARELGLRTVTEGIEVPEELAWAREHGADYVQGYLLGRPAEYPTLNYLPA